MTSSNQNVYAGIDTHADTHHVAVIDELGRKLGDKQFPTTRSGYHQLLAFLHTFGLILRIGVEGTASYGAGLTAYLRSQQILVREIIRPNRQARRNGKSDPIDAYAAARAVAVDEELPIPKLLGGQVDLIRVTLKTRATAVKARTAAITQIKNFLITAPAELREAYTALSTERLIAALAQPSSTPDDQMVRSLCRLANRVEFLDDEVSAADDDLAALTSEVAPALTYAKEIGPVSAAQLLVTAGENPDRITSKAAFAALCGVSPIPASSGKITRHRLNRGGDRQANAALYRIVTVRKRYDQRTQAYVAKRTAEGKTAREITRCLKRYVANEVYTLITSPTEVPSVDDLRPLRQHHKISLQAVADHFGVWPIKVSTIERAKSRDDQFVEKYRKYLLEAG
ncbi:MAG: IS110 family transposase [Yaniella sp.]|uniref:IS110 family transposase n=1 Tax=Yaniella sp. TaxID=2773929 RepID=UPI002647DD67|nr:IS110 family transposase [Yaniella sp.]MDN5704928.1 IS110 family transposase [Yaniella sp.]MDN5839396.1 IS110 family transposase [Yaniella sp.]MDN6410588.1 IS110 family transposase [Yaniella sp.]MDN6759417.1 IS110 family transposase [Yaniella sp.]